MIRSFDKDNWDIIYYRENYDRETIHLAHPNHAQDHSHKVGYIYLRKIAKNKELCHQKRIMNRTFKKGSIFGRSLK